MLTNVQRRRPTVMNPPPVPTRVVLTPARVTRVMLGMALNAIIIMQVRSLIG